MQAPLGAKAVSEIHALFSWAKKSKQGLLLFIDEAEAFLGTREDSGTSEHRRNVLSALLYHSGTQSDKYMLVLASNRPGDLDSAITDRMDEALLFDLPNPRQRVIMLTQYFIQVRLVMPLPPSGFAPNACSLPAYSCKKHPYSRRKAVAAGDLALIG